MQASPEQRQASLLVGPPSPILQKGLCSHVLTIPMGTGEPQIIAVQPQIQPNQGRKKWKQSLSEGPSSPQPWEAETVSGLPRSDRAGGLRNPPVWFSASLSGPLRGNPSSAGPGTSTRTGEAGLRSPRMGEG